MKFQFGIVDQKLVLNRRSEVRLAARSICGGTKPAPPSFDKQFVRDYLKASIATKRRPAPWLLSEMIERTSAKYQEAFQRFTGHELV